MTTTKQTTTTPTAALYVIADEIRQVRFARQRAEEKKNHRRAVNLFYKLSELEAQLADLKKVCGV
tara:strand:- start:464 stop:658 length:195 start_codon:yes stop_codon:yes gene_type:complete